jgi:predicted PurR-regulated permease PerM
MTTIGARIRRLVVASPPPAPSEESPLAGAAGPVSRQPHRASGPRPGEPVQWLAFEPRALHRSVVFVLLAVSLWMLGVWAFGALAHFLFLLLLAWLAAAAMEPEIAWFVRRGWSRGAATATTGLVGALVTLGLLALFGTELAKQISQLVTSWPQIVESAVAWLNQTFGFSLDPDTVIAKIDVSRLSEWAGTVAQGAVGILGTLGSLTFDLLTVLVFAFYLAAAGPSLLASLATWFPPGHQHVFGSVWETTMAKTGGYVISKVVLIALSVAAHGILFWAIGLPGWLALAFLAGITAQLIPMVGTYIGVIAAVLVALFEEPLDAVWVVVFAVIYQQIETYVFTPRVSKRVMDVSAPIALGSVFVGVALWGPIGALIGIPLAAVVVSLVETYGRRYPLVPQIDDEGYRPVEEAEQAEEAAEQEHDSPAAPSLPADADADAEAQPVTRAGGTPG